LQEVRTRRAEEERETFFLGGFGERAREAEKPKRATAPTRTNPLGSKQEHGYKDGQKPLERQPKAGRFSEKAPERKGVFWKRKTDHPCGGKL
jgi:hypothetical protein